MRIAKRLRAGTRSLPSDAPHADISHTGLSVIVREDTRGDVLGGLRRLLNLRKLQLFRKIMILKVRLAYKSLDCWKCLAKNKRIQ